MKRPSTWFDRLVALLWGAVALVLGLVVFCGVVTGLDALAEAVVPRAFTPDRVHVLGTVVLLVKLVYWIAAVVLAGFVAAVVGRRAPRTHALTLGLLLACFFAFNVWQALHGPDPVWWHAATLVLVLPAALVGGGMYAVRRARKAALDPF